MRPRRCFYNHLVWASRALGVLIVLQVIHKTLFAPLVITVATNALVRGRRRPRSWFISSSAWEPSRKIAAKPSSPRPGPTLWGC